jgi:hypothetical protein
VAPNPATLTGDIHAMRIVLKLVCPALLGLLAACQANLPPPSERTLDRTVARVGGPERVFARPVAEIVPLLQGARASGPDGRVGFELVFWGYELATNRQATLVACAVLPDVDCAARLAKVCQSGTPEVLFTAREGGEVRSRSCQAIGIARPGDLTPNCVEIEETQPVELSLLSCN